MGNLHTHLHHTHTHIATLIYTPDPMPHTQYSQTKYPQTRYPQTYYPQTYYLLGRPNTQIEMSKPNTKK